MAELLLKPSTTNTTDQTLYVEDLFQESTGEVAFELAPACSTFWLTRPQVRELIAHLQDALGE